MTHEDIYTKFLIEYDKDNITSSYPSLTRFEIATILDKAYLGLIARKITGNNPRRSIFESDVKAVEDLRPLIVTEQFEKVATDNIIATNEYVYRLPNLLYYLRGQIVTKTNNSSIDNLQHLNQNVRLIDHETASSYRSTDTNLPWIKEPVSFIEGDFIHVLIDPYKQANEQASMNFFGTYLKTPNKFVLQDNTCDFGDTIFELSDTMAEEMINLAVLFAIENVESTRLQAKTSTLPLES